MHPLRKFHFDVVNPMFEKSWKKALTIGEGLPVTCNVIECAYCEYGIVDASPLNKTFIPKSECNKCGEKCFPKNRKCTTCDSDLLPEKEIVYLPKPKGKQLGTYLGSLVCRNCRRKNHVLNLSKVYIPRIEDFSNIFGSYTFFTTFLQGEHMKETLISKYESALEKKFKLELRTETNEIFLTLDRLKAQKPYSKATLHVSVNNKIFEYEDPSRIYTDL
jgi:hypothetical protein